MQRVIYSRARESCTRLSRASWSDWVVIGEALTEARREAIESASASGMVSKLARNKIALILKREKLDGIDKSVRSDLLFLMDNRAIVEAWRGTLSVSQRMKWNSPKTIRRHFKTT